MAAAVNRSVSPMLVHRENFEESRNVVLEKLEKLRKEQKSKSPFLIGTIGEVSKRISHLDNKLQNYTELVAESRASDFPELVPPSTAARRERVDKRERDEKDLTRFAGVYSIKSTFGVSDSERVKNVSKITMNPSKTVAKKDTGKPKFVELYNYAGFDLNHTTPLPDDVPVLQIIKKVTKAQQRLQKKSTYRTAFEKIIESPASQAILLDGFWWCFLKQFQTDRDSQCHLFRRISLNYVKLLLSCNDIYVREAFMREYPDVLAQSIYAAFCESFPDSYRQFDDAFKELLVCTAWEWIVGTKPSPGSYKSWNYDSLEPANIKQREELMKKKDNNKNKMKTSMNIESLIGGGTTQSSSVHSSQTTLNQAGSRDSVTSSGHRLSDPINKVAHAQSRSRRSGGTTSPRDTNHLSVAQLPTIRESYSRENETPSTERTRSRAGRGKIDRSSYWNRAYNKPRESHTAGRGPDFCRNAFNLHGQSPLVAQFLQENNLAPQTGCDVIVQRTEIDRLPSSDEETYLDVVKRGYDKVRQRRKETRALFQEGRRAHGAFSRQQQSEVRQLQTKEAALLTNPREVKRLCNLIMLEQRKDEDSIPAGVEAAVEQALDLAMEQMNQSNS